MDIIMASPKRKPKPRPPHKAGFVSIVGFPNVGKSTLLNMLIGQKVSIATPKPQTTRNRITGIKTHQDYQIVFTDSPGILLHHAPKDMFSRFVQSEAFASTHEAQVILYMLDATKLSKKFNEKKKDEVIHSIKELPIEEIPIIILLNKVDLVKDKTQLLPMIEFASKITKTGLCIPVSAKTGDGSDIIIDEILKYLPEMDRLYSKDFITLLRERDLVSEIIREKVMLYCHQEIPYSAAVTIDNFHDTRPESTDESNSSELSENIVPVKKNKSRQNTSNPMLQKNLPEKISSKKISTKKIWPKKIWPKKIWIDATIHIEKSSQKKIIIGAHGSGIKHIGQQARADIEELLQYGVMLKLFVRVDPDWKMQTSRLKEFGYASSP